MSDSTKVPRVSVVMSTRNEPRVGEAIESILGQSFPDLELIVVDDGSSDGTAQSLSDHARRDARLRVLKQPGHGLTRALIRGCKAATGDVIARQDSDDWSPPMRIEEQLRLLESDENIGFVSCSTQYVGPEGEPLIVIERPTDPARATSRLLNEKEGPPAHGSVMFRKSVYEEVGGYREEFYFAQDSDLWLRMAERALIAYVPEVRYVHRLGLTGASGALWRAQREFGDLGQLCRAARRRGLPETAYLAHARRLTLEISSAKQQGSDKNALASLRMAYLVGSLLTSRGDPRACRYLARVVRAKPWHMKAWIRMAQVLLRGKTRDHESGAAHS